MAKTNKDPILQRNRINSAREIGWLVRNRIHQLCTQQQMTLPQLAQKSGVSLSTIRTLATAEECHAKFGTVAKIGWAFGLTPCQFLNEKLLPPEIQKEKDSSLRAE